MTKQWIYLVYLWKMHLFLILVDWSPISEKSLIRSHEKYMDWTKKANSTYQLHSYWTASAKPIHVIYRPRRIIFFAIREWFSEFFGHQMTLICLVYLIILFETLHSNDQVLELLESSPNGVFVESTSSVNVCVRNLELNYFSCKVRVLGKQLD